MTEYSDMITGKLQVVNAWLQHGYNMYWHAPRVSNNIILLFFSPEDQIIQYCLFLMKIK